MSPEDQAKLRRLQELQFRADAARVPSETVSSPVVPPTPPSAPPSEEDIAKLRRYQDLNRQAELRQGDVGLNAAAAAGEAVAGAVTGAGFMAGGVAGAKIGATAGALTGPAAPVMAPALGATGFVVGGVAGALAGDLATRPVRDILAEKGYIYPSIQEAPEFVRPYLYGAQSLGGSAAGIGAMNVLAQSSLRMRPSWVGRQVNSYLDAFKQRTAFVNTREAVAATGAAVGVTTTALTTRSDDWGTLLAGEIAGGGLLGNSFTWMAADWANRQFARVAKRFSSSAQETEAGRLLAAQITKYGGDPVQTIAALEAVAEDLAGLPPALAADSPGLRAVQNLIMATNPEAASNINQMTTGWFEAQTKVVFALRQLGNPQDLRLAAQLENDLMAQYVDTAIDAARESVAVTMSRLPAMDGLEREAVGVALYDELIALNKRAKDVERSLWAQVDRNIPARTDLFLEGLAAVQGGMNRDILKAESNPALKAFISRLRGEAPTATADDLLAGIPDADDPALREFLGGILETAEPPMVWELQQMRSYVLDLQRATSAGQTPNSVMTRYYGEVADLLLTQIQASLPEGVDAAYDTARAYTKAYHETFSQTFVGDAAVRNREGAAFLSPELMIDYATVGRAGKTALRFEEMRKAMDFLPGRGIADPENTTAVIDMQNRILRSFAADTTDAAGRISRNKAEKFLSDYASTLAFFPDVDQDLRKALESTEALEALQGRFQLQQKERDALMGLGRILEVDNPATTIGGALTSDTPITQFRALVREVSDALPPGQRDAFFPSVLDWARGVNDDLPLTAVLDNLLQPMGKYNRQAGAPSPVDVMVQENLLPDWGADFLRKTQARVSEVTARAADPTITGTDIVPETIWDALIVANLRFAGAALGTAARGGMTSNAGMGLQAAQQGSNLIQRVFDKLPRQAQMNLITRAAQDQELMVRLLKKASTPDEQMKAILFALAYVGPSIGNAISGDDGIQLDFGSEEE